MESDEKYIESRFGKAQPFKVPEGYFDSLAQAIMEKTAQSSDEINSRMLPVEGESCCRLSVKSPALSEKLWWRSRRCVAAAAACALLVVGGVSAYRTLEHHPDSAVHTVVAQGGSGGSAQSGLCDDEIDYTMLDNEGMYSLMASN